MAGSVYCVPRSRTDGEWKTPDDLLDDLQYELARYCLCAMARKDADEEVVLSCAPNDACDGEDCEFWILSYELIWQGKACQSVQVHRFGEPRDPEPSPNPGPLDKAKLTFGDEHKVEPVRTLRFPKNNRDGDMHRDDRFWRIVFCSCGLQGAILAKQESHRSINPPPPMPRD